MANKVFLSYNHKDKAVAVRIENYLTAAGLDVIRDETAMRSGEDIRKFILRSIRASGVTLSVVSTNSLLSAWVSLETVLSQVEADMERRYFIPAYIEDDFFDRRFTLNALRQVEAEIKDIDALIKEQLAEGFGIRNLQDELQRYRDLSNNFDGIIGRLQGMRCVNISGDDFDSGMEKIAQDIKAAEIPAASSRVRSGTETSKENNLTQIKAELRGLFAKARETTLIRKLKGYLDPQSEVYTDLLSIEQKSNYLKKSQNLMYPQEYNVESQRNQQRLLHLIEDLSMEDLD